MMALQYLRSLVFNVTIYVAMLVIAVVFAPMALFSRTWALRACRTWSLFVRWLLRWLVGLRTEVRGRPPEGEAVIAAKHQSFLDIIMIFSSIPAGKFIMKRELVYAPLLGQYALAIGCVPVDRGKRGQAIAKMMRDVAEGARAPGQLIIYPQGTRVAPGDKRPYKVGTGLLYEQLGQPCYPVAANVGCFWPKRGVLRKPGVAVVEFLDPIPPGLPVKAFMSRIEREIETASDALIVEAGGPPPDQSSGV